jgi:hypothetical protein
VSFGRGWRAGPALVSAGLLLLGSSIVAAPVLALGVGDATWTPARSKTTVEPSRFLVPGDSITFRTEATWDAEQAAGLAAYVASGLRYTHEVNDRSGRLSATGYWATDHPDPAFDRDDDDGDGRWEEAEVTAGTQVPETGRVYTSLVQLSRWHAKREAGECRWVWDRRMGAAEILSQLSRGLLGEWQAERYTLSYGASEYPRVDARKPALEAGLPARCREERPREGQSGVTVTFSEPLAWQELLALPGAGSGRWTAFEAIGSSPAGEMPWTCGGPVSAELALRPCRGLGVTPDGVVAAIGYFDGAALDILHSATAVARVSELQDSLTGLLFEVGGFGVVAPGLTVNDAWWELHPAGR